MPRNSLRVRSSVLFVAILTAALAAACSGGVGGNPSGSTCPSDSTLTYANFGQAFIASNCLACHSRESPTLSSQADIQANIGEIDRVAAAGPNGVNTAMPQGSSISTADRTKLGEWLACGAP